MSINKMPSTKLIVKYVVLALAILLAIYLLSYGVRVGRYKQVVTNLEINEVDLTSIPDGTYTGTCDVDFIAATVEVAVADHQITNINLLKHHNEKGGPAEALIPKIVDTQSLDVDAIAGASNSSKVIKKAIENALISHQNN